MARKKSEKELVERIVYSRLTNEENEMAARIAARLGRAKSDFIRLAVKEYIKRYEDDLGRRRTRSFKTVDGKAKITTSITITGDIAERFHRLAKRYEFKVLPFMRKILEFILIHVYDIFEIWLSLEYEGKWEEQERYIGMLKEYAVGLKDEFIKEEADEKGKEEG